MMASSARRETRVKKQDSNEQHSDGKTLFRQGSSYNSLFAYFNIDVPEQPTVSPTPPSQRQYKQKFTLCNTITSKSSL
jgi:hypothetical protein